MHALLIILRLLHILSAAFWFGAVAVVAAFVLPSVRALGPGGGPMMNQLAQVRKLPMRLLVSGWVAVLSGLGLFWYDGYSGGNAWYGSAMGRTLSIGALLGIIVVLLGTFVNMPTAKRMAEVGAKIQAAGGAPAPELTGEMQRLQMKLKRLTETGAAMLALAAAAMAVARYL